MTSPVPTAQAQREPAGSEESPTARTGRFAKLSRPTRGDLAFSALVGALFAVSPMTGSARLAPSLALGAIAGGAVLVARMRRPRVADAARARFTFARPSPLAAAVLVVAALAFAPTLDWLVAEYTDAIWHNGYGVFVPFFMILLARHALRRDTSAEEESSAWGFALLGPGVALAVLDAGIRSHYLSVIGLVLALPGLSLLLLGARRTRMIAVPLALGIFLVPPPTSLEQWVGLAEGTVALARPLLVPLDLPITWKQTQVILSAGYIISISQNCSGASALYAGIAFATMAAATARHRVRRWLPLLVVYPIVLVANALRCVTLILLCLYLGRDILHTPIHGLSGIAVYAAVLVSLCLCADRKSLREALS